MSNEHKTELACGLCPDEGPRTEIDIPYTARTFPTTQASSVSLLSLPDEILAQIYELFAWQPTSPNPPVGHRQELLIARLVCSRVCGVATPILFRTVRIHVQWKDGWLVAPRIYRLRRCRPELVKYVRHLHIEQGLETPVHQKNIRFVYLQEDLGMRPRRVITKDHPRKVFSSPSKASSWELPPEEGPGMNPARFHSHVNDFIDETLDLFPTTKSMLSNQPQGQYFETPAARLRHLLDQDFKLCQQLDVAKGQKSSPYYLGCAPLWPKVRQSDVPDAEAFDAITEQRYVRLRLHALAYIMLCLPPISLHTLTVSAACRWPVSVQHDFQEAFMAHVVAGVLRFHCPDSLRHLGAEAYKVHFDKTRPPLSWRHAFALRESLQTCAVTAPTLRSLQIPLAEGKEFKRESSAVLRSLTVRSALEPLLPLALTLQHLALRDTHIWLDDLLWFLSGFTGLKTLFCRYVILGRQGQTTRSYILRRPWSSWTVQPWQSIAPWLTMLWKVRRLLPNLNVHVEMVSDGGETSHLPSGALRWLMRVTDPSAEKEQGLKQDLDERELQWERDFEQYYPTWVSEQNIRDEAEDLKRRERQDVAQLYQSPFRELLDRGITTIGPVTEHDNDCARSRSQARKSI